MSGFDPTADDDYSKRLRIVKFDNLGIWLLIACYILGYLEKMNTKTYNKASINMELSRTADSTPLKNSN